MKNQQSTSYPSFYLRHKGLLINLFSVLTFLGIDKILDTGDIDQLNTSPWLGWLFILAYAFEPWATYYSMGAMNERREKAGLKVIFLHQWLNNIPVGILFWAGRISILGVVFMTSLQAVGINYSLLRFDIFKVIIVIILLVREIFVVYYMASKKPLPNFKESYDFTADLILMIILAFGQLIIAELYRDLGLKGMNSALDFIYFLFPILLLFFVFYLPIRYLYTVEDFTFAKSGWDKAEQVLSFLIVFIGFIVAA